MSPIAKNSLRAVMLALFVLAFLHYGLRALPWPWSGIASFGYNVGAGITVIAAVLAAGRLRWSGDSRGERAWQSIALAALSLLVAQSVNVFRHQELSLPSAEIISMFVYPASISAIWMFGPSRGFRAARAVATIEIVMLIVAALTFWAAVELWRSVGPIPGLIVTHWYSLLVPALAVVTFTMAGLYFMRRSGVRPRGDAVAVPALMLIAMADMSFAISPPFWDVWSGVLASGACVLLVFGATSAQAPAADAAPVAQGPSVVPFLAVGAVLASVVLSFIRTGNAGLMIVGAGAVVLVLLMVVRQWQVLKANTVLEARNAEQERRLREAERLDALGRMARGVAHDFNGMLMSILGNAELAAEDIGHDPAAARESLEYIRDAAVTASGLTSQLLAFARGGNVEIVSVDLTGAVSEQWPLLKSTLPSSVTATLDAPGSPLWVRAGIGFVPQLLHNLVTNARDAMRDGGTLHLVVEQDGAFAVLRVRDTGQGMDAETRERIFEPFFTTKGTRGSGLGLATVYGIVRQVGGDITVESEPGRGTMFAVRLPLVDSPT